MERPLTRSHLSSADHFRGRNRRHAGCAAACRQCRHRRRGARCHSRRGRPGAGQPVRCRDGAHRCGLSLGDAARRAGGPRDRLCGAAQCQPGPGQAGRAPHEASTSCRRHACGVAAACRAADVVAHAALPGRELGPAAAHRAGGPGAPG